MAEDPSKSESPVPTEGADQPQDPGTPPPEPSADRSPEKVAEEALETAGRAVEAIAAEADEATEALDLPRFDTQASPHGDKSAGLGLLNDVHLNVKIELGRTQMYVEDVLRLNENSVVELDKVAGDPVDIYVNNRRIARGEVLVLNENFCVRVSEIIDEVSPED